MPSGSIPHGQERPNANKRHAQTRKQGASRGASISTAFPTVEQIEREWAMNKTLLDLIALTRRYTTLARMGRAETADLAELDALFTVTAFVACAKLPDSCPEIAGLIKKTERLSRLLHGDRGDA